MDALSLVWSLILPLVQGGEEAAVGLEVIPGIEEVPGIPPSVQLIAIVSMVFSLLVVAVIAAAVIYIVRHRSKQRERLAALAIQHGQPEAAVEIAMSRSRWFLWVAGAIIAIVIAANLPDWGLLIVVALAVVTIKQWYPVIFKNGKDKRAAAAPPPPTGPEGPAATPADAAPLDVAPPEADAQAQDDEKPGGPAIGTTLSSWLMMF